MEPSDFLPPDEPQDDLPNPRCGHYTLAHHALRGVALSDPLFFLSVLASDGSQRFLADLMRRVQEHCKDREPLAEFGVEEIAVHRRRLGSYPCAVVELPRPLAVAEAHFVAAVLLADPASLPPDATDVPVRYFTLEKGMTFGDGVRTVLCEWTRDASHRNFGDGPEATVEGFVEAIERLINR